MNQIAELLFKHHAHADTVYHENIEQIVYREADVIAILKTLGHPEPEWDAPAAESLKDQYERLKREGYYDRLRAGWNEEDKGTDL